MGRRTRKVLLLLLAFSFRIAELTAAGQQSESEVLPIASLMRLGDARAIVLFFIASDCPISNRQLPEMLRIQHEFTGKGVRFWFVYPNSNETSATIRAHRAAYKIDRNIRTDPNETLAKFTGANVTPEAAVLIPNAGVLKAVYTGRIDDRYLSIGTERPAATRHDLEDAIAAVLTNHPVPRPGGPPVGCAFTTLGTR